MGRIPETDESAAENAVLEATAPKSAVEKTPGGRVELAVENVLVETQNDEPVASALPFVPLNVASAAVTPVAACVTGAGPTAADASGADARRAMPNELVTSADTVRVESTLLILCKVMFLIG